VNDEKVRKLKKKIYRDPMRSSHSHFVKVSGLRWLSMMLLVEIPWAQRVWALPFATTWHHPNVTVNSINFAIKLIDWARQMFQANDGFTTRELVVVADSSFAALELLAAVSQTSNANT